MFSVPKQATDGNIFSDEKRKILNDIHVSGPTLSDTLFVKAFKKNNGLIFFGSKYTVGNLRVSTIQEKYNNTFYLHMFIIK